MSERRPLSLNDRHNRVLQDLSASRPRNPPPPVTAEETMPAKVKIQGRRRLCKASYVEPKDENAPEFSGFSDFDSPAPFGDGESGEVKVKDVREVNISEICVAEDERIGEDGDGKDELEAPRFSILSDSDSPTPVKKRVEGNEEEDGGNEIRDILNELSSKLDLLSVERPRVPKPVIPMRGSQDVASTEVDEYEGNDHLLEQDSVAASFFDSSAYDESSKGIASQSKVVDKLPIKLKEKDEVAYESKSYVKGNKDYNGAKVGRAQVSNAPKRSVMKSHQSSTIYLDDDDDDDCTMMSGSKFGKGPSRHCKVEDDASCLAKPFDIGDENDDQSIVISGPKSTYTLPGKIAKMLYPHQRDGLKWLWSLHCQGKGGILGDDMGLGKTMQICGFLAGLFTSRLIKRVLIVAPKTLLPHWIKELSVVGLSKKTRDYFGTSSKLREYELQYILQDKGILLTTYDIVRNNAKSLSGVNYYGDELDDEILWDYMILDEGHLIKNPSTQRAKSLLEIPSAHRVIISGTPIQNNLKELWALFNFCCPDLLGDKNWFKVKYENLILRGNDKNASERDKRIGSTVAKELREVIQPYFLRRLKSEVFNQNDDSNSASLSTKNEIIVWLRLTACQQRLYEAFLNSEIVLSAFDGSPLAALTILKKICDHPLLLTRRAAEDVLEGMDSSLNQDDLRAAEKLATHIADNSDTFGFQDEHDQFSCKILFIMALLDNLIPEGHNVLIFSQTRKMLNLIQESLVTRGYAYQRIDGTTKPCDRLKIVNDFQDGIGAPIFLLTSQVGGLGLTLTKADRVIVVDPAWNPSTDNQSVDRAYRIGQKKDVIVYRLMTSGTVEEKIYRKQVFKGGLFKTATEHKEQVRYFSQQDLRELFSLPKDGFDVSVTQQQLQAEHGHQQNMDESLKEHVKFLENLGIAGISNHSLLFSKTAPVSVPEDGDDLVRQRETATYYKNSSSINFVEPNVDGSAFAFKPKDVELKKSQSNSSGSAKLTESDIKQKINRLSVIYADKNTLSRLPDKGEKIQKQIAELNLELAKQTQVIDLDEVTGDLERTLRL
uniref:Protein CHROMATIN REMODELING 24 n=1 Tax=Kalanchoe fedtschenkoi TaxID=63787 RepID=A0A7N0TBK3_KALFE